MTEYEETIKHFESLQKRYIKTHNGTMCKKVDMALSALKENASLKARLEKAVELPCKVGDTVYYISFRRVHKGKCHAITIQHNGVQVHLYDCEKDNASISGKHVYLTKEEAEAAKEREENDN